MNSIVKNVFIVWICFSALLFANDVFKGVLKEEIQKAAPGERFRVIILMKDQVDVAALDAALTQNRASLQYRHQLIVESLQQKTDETQGDILARISTFQESGEVTFLRSFWLMNAVNIEAVAKVIKALSEREDIAAIYKDGYLSLDKPVMSAPSSESINSAEPGLKVINAHRLWKMGITGEGVIVMNIDTGVDGSHPALASRWRGNDPGVSASEAWFDPELGASSPEDIAEHGTHTMGIITGLDASNNDTIGVAFNAKWIAARTIDVTFPHTSNTVAAFQWAADPDGDPGTVDDVPAVINCSWLDSNISNCDQTYWQVIDNVEALGTAVVFSAGNSGPDPQTITPPKNRISSPVNIFATGSVDGHNPNLPISSTSSRGPSACDGQTKKPEAVAPGVNVRSSVPGGGYDDNSGTSMAAPHVAGAVALLRSAFPWMTGTELKTVLLNTARDLGPQGEDNTYGMGIIDVYAAYNYLKRTVTLDQVRESGARMTGSFIGHWVDTEFVDHEITTPPPSLTFYGPTQEVFRGKQDRITNPDEKFNRWNNEQDVRNHREFDIEPGESELTSHFEPTYDGITLQNNFLSAIPGFDPSNDEIAFKDPWLIDYEDPNYGNNERNQGMSAPFKSRLAPFNPDYTTSYNGDVYKGVFLNQGLPNWHPPLLLRSRPARAGDSLPRTGHHLVFSELEWY